MKQFDICLGDEDYTVKQGTKTEMGNDWGDVDPPHTPYPRYLRYRRGLTPHDLMMILIHESLHVQDWDASEEWVHNSAKEIRNLLWKMGYRLVIDPTEE